jgi:type IV secretion system protein VirB2
MINFKFTTFLACVLLTSLMSFANVQAISRLQPCKGVIAGGSGADGSDCDAGLVCFPDSKLCGAQNETPCRSISQAGLSMSCPAGQRCTNDADGSIAVTGVNGICMPITGASAENNVISDLICNVYRLITGKVGRGVVVVVILVTGFTFYFGKISWGSLITIVLGVGLVFGGPAIVNVMVGKGFVC